MSDDVVICLVSASGYDRVAQGVAGAGRALAGQLGGSLKALLVGPADEATVSAVGSVADAVTVADAPELASYQPEPYLAALEQVCRRIGPRAILLGSDLASVELAPRLAHRLGGSPMSDGNELTVAGGAVRVRRSAYGGKAEAVFELKRSPAVVWVRARGFAPAEPTGAQAPVERTPLELPATPPSRIVGRQIEQQEGIPLEEAQLVVGGGRGIGGAEPFEEIKKLAAAMGAAVGASRSACDEGWVPPSWQVGQTGKKIAPELYLAVAVSGAAQHMLGVSDAKRIAAINTDPDAPIFRHCNFGFVEDYRKVVPLLIERLRELKQ
jgi:electron transfer flavoprotein alpha subunit